MTEHRASPVLEMPRGILLWCLGCSKPWPCKDAPDHAHYPECPYPQDRGAGNCQCVPIARDRHNQHTGDTP